MRENISFIIIAIYNCDLHIKECTDTLITLRKKSFFTMVQRHLVIVIQLI